MRPAPLLLFILLFFSLPMRLAAAEVDSRMTVEQAAAFLNGIDGQVVSVEPSEIPGFFQIGMKMQDQVVPLYLDRSGTFLFSGNIIDLAQRKNLTEEHYRKLNPIDISQIPADEGMLLGNPDAPHQSVVFTDPDCPFCSKFHTVLLKAVKSNPELSFRIKVTPLKESSYQTARTILCNKSMEQLEQAFAGTSLTATECDSSAADDNLALARSLGIRGTPTLILPNGQLAPGFRPLDELLSLIDANR